MIYGLLFQAASETLLKLAGDPKHLGAVISFLAVLHTWGQTLQHHPHLLFASSEWLRHNLGIKSSAVQINLLEIHQHYCATLDVAIGTDAGCHPEKSRFQHGTRY